MLAAPVGRPRRQRVEHIHQWRPRRSQMGELVQWDTSEHDWLEGRGERLYLILMIDEARSRAGARLSRITAAASIDGQLRGERPKTRIGRALDDLGIEWIAAHSPQAKGRVERFFGTAQDRLGEGPGQGGGGWVGE